MNTDTFSNTKCRPCCHLMLVHSLRCWPSIEPAQGQRLVFSLCLLVPEIFLTEIKWLLVKLWPKSAKLFSIRGPSKMTLWSAGTIQVTLCVAGSYLPLWDTSILLCKGKWQYLITCKVSRYCFFALHSSIIALSLFFVTMLYSNKASCCLCSRVARCSTSSRGVRRIVLLQSLQIISSCSVDLKA